MSTSPKGNTIYSREVERDGMRLPIDFQSTGAVDLPSSSTRSCTFNFPRSNKDLYFTYLKKQDKIIVHYQGRRSNTPKNYDFRNS
jgi:hypothetical protein